MKESKTVIKSDETPEVKNAVRPADDRSDKAAPTIDSIFSDYEVIDPKLRGTLHVRNLPKGLHAHFATNDPRCVARILEQGYKPLEDVETDLGITCDGVYTHSTGQRVKIYVCKEEHRTIRASQTRREEDARIKEVYQDEFEKGGEAPISGDREKSGKGLPPGYQPEN